ncbi:unnamed protein product [Trichogramma brassicae]|uniref:Uncharacterized protein n=1 Tax=Trichogramma brassicae TaxID=86971 RepID=A0A6H5IEA6_9HYME|nr:unnamed protein product [Trichogramma brassicae]
MDVIDLTYDSDHVEVMEIPGAWPSRGRANIVTDLTQETEEDPVIVNFYPRRRDDNERPPSSNAMIACPARACTLAGGWMVSF